MSEVSWPSPDNGRLVTEAQYEQMAAHFTEDGFYMNPDGANVDISSGPVYADSSTPRGVKVKAERYANLRGFGYYSGTSVTALSIDPNTSGTTRIDLAVLELNRSTWNVRSKIVKGTAGSGVPALTRDEGPTGVFQMPVAEVTVPNGATVIAPANVVAKGHRVGSRVRAWLNAADQTYPKLGELGFDKATKSWFGWDGSKRVSTSYDSGWVPMSAAWTTVWSLASGLTRVRNKNGFIFASMQLTRINSTFNYSDSNGSKLVILPGNFRPSDYVYGSFVATNGASGRLMVKDKGDSDAGAIWATDISKDIPKGHNIRCSISFPLD